MDNEGRPATVEVIASDLGAQEEAEAVPFVALTYDARHAGEFVITVGKDPDLVDHRVDDPEKVWVERSSSGQIVGLALLSRTGTQTILRFQNDARQRE